jgi:hypothetical protein
MHPYDSSQHSPPRLLFVKLQKVKIATGERATERQGEAGRGRERQGEAGRGREKQGKAGRQIERHRRGEEWEQRAVKHRRKGAEMWEDR